jgi:hypothetical protein
MSDRRKLRHVLSMLTEGEKASVPRRLKKAAAEAARSAQGWLAGADVQGLGIARKRSGDATQDALAIRVYVKRKLPKERCDSPVPPRVRVPGLDGEFLTDVEGIGTIRPQENTGRARPALGGYSISHTAVNYGTLGCLVRRVGDPDNRPLILSCSHVLANYGLAQKGDRIVQPGTFDQDGPGDYGIGLLEDFVPFIFSEAGYPNIVDAAIARADALEKVSPAIRLLGVPQGVSVFVREGMQVQKTGRKSDWTTGKVTDPDFRFDARYPRTATEYARLGFRDQVLCTRLTSDGDSGSAVLNSALQVVGMHIAGSESVSIFSKIGSVLSQLGVEIITSLT